MGIAVTEMVYPVGMAGKWLKLPTKGIFCTSAEEAMLLSFTSPISSGAGMKTRGGSAGLLGAQRLLSPFPTDITFDF